MKLSIRARTLLIVVLPQFLLAALLGFYFIQMQIKEIDQDLQLLGVRSVRYLAGGSEFLLVSGNYAELNDRLASAIEEEDLFEGLMIIAADGSIIAAAGAPVERELARACWVDPSNCRKASRLVFSAPMNFSMALVSDNPEFLGLADPADYRPADLGTALLVVSSESLLGMQRNLLVNGVLIVLFSVVLTVFVARSFARGLSLPIQRLSRVVARIQGGDLAARTEQLASGELGDLEVGINEMAKRVQEADSQLRSKVEQATEELSATLDSLEHRNTELEEAREVAEGAGRAKDMFLARMSHELRTPLATVIGYSRLILMADNEAQKIEYAQIMEQAADLLQVTIDDILDHVRLQDGVVHLDKTEFNLLDCIENAVAMHVPAAHDKRVELISCCDDSLPVMVEGDAVRLAQIVTNLLSNAIKFTDEGHVILHSFAEKISDKESMVTISVRDSGIGISGQQQAQLFQPFVQADESIIRNFGGSGLGLAIVKKLTEYMGGEVQLTSEPGRGTLVEITVVLPVIAQDGHHQGQALLSSTDQIVGFDAIGEVGNIVCQNLELFGGEVQSHDYFDHFIQDIRVSTPALVIASFRFGDEIRARVADIKGVYQGPFLILTSDANAIDNWDNQWLARHDRILKKPIKRDQFRRVCRELIQGVEREENMVRAPVRLVEKFQSTVLVVEDNPLNLKLIVTQIEGHGARVLAATSGPKALAMIESTRPDLAFIDVHMPGMDGVTLASRLAETWPELPIYALTANVMGTEESDLFAAGVREVFYKPISDDALVAVLANSGVETGRVIQDESQTRLRVPKGMLASEIIGELNVLNHQARSLAHNAEREELTSVCHKLNGVIRMFTRGKLAQLVQELESLAHKGEHQAVFSILDELQTEVDRLGFAAEESG